MPPGLRLERLEALFVFGRDHKDGSGRVHPHARERSLKDKTNALEPLRDPLRLLFAGIGHHDEMGAAAFEPLLALLARFSAHSKRQNGEEGYEPTYEKRRVWTHVTNICSGRLNAGQSGKLPVSGKLMGGETTGSRCAQNSKSIENWSCRGLKASSGSAKPGRGEAPEP